MNTLFSNQNTVTTYEVSLQPLRLLPDVVAECVAAGVSRPVDPAHAARVLWAATSAVDAIIRRDDQLKEEVVGPMMGDEWPSRRVFPNRTVDDGDDVRLGGLTLSVRELGPGESHVDSLWQLDARTVFAGDVAYNGMHAYLADGHWRDWLATLDRLEADLPDDVTLFVGHGSPGGKDLLAAQRRYIETFVNAVEAHADAIDHGDHRGVTEAMQRLLPTDSLLFLMDLSIEPTLAALRQAR